MCKGVIEVRPNVQENRYKSTFMRSTSWSPLNKRPAPKELAQSNYSRTCDVKSKQCEKHTHGAQITQLGSKLHGMCEEIKLKIYRKLINDQWKKVM